MMVQEVLAEIVWGSSSGCLLVVVVVVGQDGFALVPGSCWRMVVRC